MAIFENCEFEIDTVTIRMGKDGLEITDITGDNLPEGAREKLAETFNLPSKKGMTHEDLIRGSTTK